MRVMPCLKLRPWGGLLGAATIAVLFGCAGSSGPVQLYQLRAAAPLPLPAARVNSASAVVWQLATPVKLPDYLDQTAVLVPQGQAGLLALPGQRWAEPLRESVPRVLRADLALLLGQAQVWSAPVPAGVVVDKLLRLELLALESNAERTAVNLQARWSITDPSGRAAPVVQTAVISVPSASADVDSLVAAHRLALWRLAERIAAQ
jgi:uncharacterized protein